MGKKRPPTGKTKRRPTEEELEERGWQREERRHKWTHGHGTQIQACVAKLAYPPADPAFIRHLVSLAWTPEYAVVLSRMIDEARRTPGVDGANQAIEAAREVWNDIWGEPAKRGGWPDRLNDKLRVWVNFNVMLLGAQQRGKVGKRETEKAFVERHGLGQPVPVKTVSALRKILGQVVRATSKAERDDILSLYAKP